MPARRIPLTTELSTGPFTRREAIAYGIPLDVLRGPSVQTIDRGIFPSADLELTLKRRLAGYLLVLPRDTVVDSVTALQLNGIDVGPAMDAVKKAQNSTPILPLTPTSVTPDRICSRRTVE